MSQPVSPELLKTLATFDTCSVANAIECFDVRLRNEGFTDSTIKSQLPDLPPMIGYAMTLRVRSSSPSWKGANYFDSTDWWTRLHAQPVPHVLVIEDEDRHPGTGAFIGEIHAAILLALGAVGAVTNGAVRDLPAIERLGFRLFSTGVAVSHAYAHIVEIGGPVKIGGLRIAPGDLLHGDRHGVVQIPTRIAGQIPETIARLRKRERHIIDYCRSADFTLDGLKKITTGDPCQPGEQCPPSPGK